MIAPAAREAGLGPSEPVFDKVIVITDRRVLDSQLQDTIYQFEHVSGCRSAYRRGLRAAGAGTRRADRPDRHHHLAEVPVRAGQGARAGQQAVRDRDRRGALVAVRRQVIGGAQAGARATGQRRHR